MSKKFKHKISALVGFPTFILAAISVNSEVLWLPVLCMSVVMAVMAWNGCFNEWLISIKNYLRGQNV